jgi:PAS domain S-box-containing protein
VNSVAISALRAVRLKSVQPPTDNGTRVTPYRHAQWTRRRPGGLGNIRMKNNRLGLVMIAASLAVIGLLVALTLAFQARSHERQIRAQGVSLSHLVASLPFDQLTAGAERRSVLKTAVGAQRSEGFAYALLVAPDGRPLVEETVPGTVVPAAALPLEPAGWYEQRELRAPDDGRRIVEFRAPVMDRGHLAGFVRLGYFGDSPRPGVEQLSYAALLALPVFLLTPLFYGLMRRETRPLAELGRTLQGMAQAHALGATPPAPDAQLRDFVERFGRFLGAAETRLRELESQRLDSVAASRLLAYRKDKVEAVLQSLPDGVIVLDEACVPTFANARLEALIGVTPAQAVGHPPREWCTQPMLLEFLLRHQARPGETAPRAARTELAPGDARDLHLSLASYPLFAPQDRDNVFGTLIVIRDTTQEHRAREAGADFVAHVSHELKTPLTSIASYTELLMEHPAPAEALRIEAVNVIHDEAQRMAALINNLLSISKLETGALKLERQRVNLRELLVDAFESQRQGAHGKGLEFRIDVPPNLGAAALDKDLFRIAINNLLGNAIKYNRPGGHVELSAEDHDDRTLAIHVRDGGIGIPADQRERIFDKYYRVHDAATEGRSGHGLGLYLVRQIVDLHQGSITVDSQPGRGTEFCIRVRKLAAVYGEALAA